MAVDPITGQSLLAYMDPTAFGQIQSDRSHADMLGSLGQQLLQSGYTPNSGWGGALAQIAQAIAGSAALNKSQEQIAGLGQRQVQALSAAEEKKRAQQAADDQAKADREVAAHLAEKKGGIELGLQYGDQTSAAEAKAAGAKALAEGTATLPLHEQEARFKANLDAQNRQPTEFERKLSAAKQMGASPEELRAMVLGNQGGGNVPSGYRAGPGGTLEAIPGGPADTSKPRQVPADVAGKVALADEYIKNYPGISKAVQGGELTGIVDASTAQMGYGHGGEVYRQIQAGRDALQRTLTGAGMPASEAAEYTKRYMPTRTDTAETLASKTSQLKTELEGFANLVRGGGTQAPQQPAASGAGPVHYIYDVASGKLVPQQ
jgi:hypothetical protein